MIARGHNVCDVTSRYIEPVPRGEQHATTLNVSRVEGTSFGTRKRAEHDRNYAVYDSRRIVNAIIELR